MVNRSHLKCRATQGHVKLLLGGKSRCKTDTPERSGAARQSFRNVILPLDVLQYRLLKLSRYFSKYRTANDGQPRTTDSTLVQVSLTSTNRCPICITGECVSPSTHKSARIWVSPFDTLCGLHWAFLHLQSSSWHREVKMFLPQIRISISDVNSNLEEDSKPCDSPLLTTEGRKAWSSDDNYLISQFHMGIALNLLPVLRCTTPNDGVWSHRGIASWREKLEA